MPEADRRLSSIMFTDMVGYTSMSETNEALALVLLEEHRQLVRPLFVRHGGKEVKTLGDGFLIEFSSVLETVRSAIEVQEVLRSRNLSAPKDRRIQLRVAVHLGDVEHREGDVYGDAVNLASRLHELAEPGGICISGQVFDLIRNNREFRTVPLGKRQLKNVNMPVEAYRVLLPGERAVPSGSALEPNRVAVLPLSMLSSDSQDEYLADGLTEELINTLSSIPGLKVIARTSTMKYKGVTKGAGEIARELNVGTVLEGSVRKAGSKVRVAVQMVDARTEEPVWAQKYDRELEDVFAIQSDIAGKVAEALKVQLFKEQRTLIERKAPENIEAYVLYLRGRHQLEQRKKDDLKRGIGYFEEAVLKDPSYALPYTGLADSYTQMGRHNWFIRPRESFEKAKTYAKKASEIDDSLAEAHASLGAIQIIYDWDWKKAEEQVRRAIQLNPNYATAHYWYSHLLFATGRLDEGVEEAEVAHVLDPLSPAVTMGLVQAYLFAGRFDASIEECRRHLDIDPSYPVAHDFLVHLYVQKGMFEDASREAQTLAKVSDRKEESLAHVAYVAVVMGRKEEARKVMDGLAASAGNEYSNPTIFIIVWSMLGDNDRAYKLLERAFEDGKVAFPSLRFSPDLKDFRADPRHVQFLKRAGLQ
ncbi:MAG TPA: adenylate/guanylate cyclase domain-containing protein [Nitrososphaerales archaeon]|nr:adenylate/guanylate cyclase domain-containing protein [Nitrososphaerales archaeon]